MVFNMSPVLFLTFLFHLTTACPAGWSQHEKQCYHFSHVQGSWAEASSYCASFGAMLAEPRTRSEINFLSGQIKHEGLGQYYLGGTDMFVEGEWIWASAKLPFSDTNWVDGEPNNSIQNSEDCLGLIQGYGKWNDVPCDAKLPFVCQTEYMITGQDGFGK